MKARGRKKQTNKSVGKCEKKERWRGPIKRGQKRGDCLVTVATTSGEKDKVT